MQEQAQSRDGSLTTVGVKGLTTFACGHERSPENTAKIGQFRVTCRACKLARSRDHYRSISRTDRQLYARVKNLPSQLDRARARVRQLETEALRLGLRDLVEAAQ